MGASGVDERDPKPKIMKSEWVPPIMPPVAEGQTSASCFGPHVLFLFYSFGPLLPDILLLAQPPEKSQKTEGIRRFDWSGPRTSPGCASRRCPPRGTPAHVIARRWGPPLADGVWPIKPRRILFDPPLPKRGSFLLFSWWERFRRPPLTFQ